LINLWVLIRAKEDARSAHLEPSVGIPEEVDAAEKDEHDYVPHFQRVSVSGEDTSGVRLEGFHFLKKKSNLLKCL